MKQINKCPICGLHFTTPFLTRRQVPIHQNLVFQSMESARQIARGDLEMVVCHNCGFIHNKSFNPAKLSYGDHYDNTQTYSPSFKAYSDGIIRYLLYEKNVQNCCIVEIGCGKGEFLKKLVRERENIGYGFDPSYVGTETALDGRLRFEKRYYGPDCSNISADVVICRHVIEHIHDPIGLLKTVRQALVNSVHAQVFFETPCVEWILKNRVIWDFFYEHCSYFTAESLTTAFEVAGFEVGSVSHVFGGQYLWLEAKPVYTQRSVAKKIGSTVRLAEEFARFEENQKRYWETKLNELRVKGKVTIWGAGAKGVTFANLLDPHCELIDCIVDLNPNKQGRFVPGTGHLIVFYQDLPKRNVATAILMNPNYRKENKSLLRKAGIKLNLINH
ncbi:class I SAM-dependent methyltransferase [Thermodesulfovibrionales bacterium]|nr:class I SAM-dependent methyltransferase [Thermodesulfovibrionales bacterium]